ncbi:uncharacterized protein BDR25DRAFT_359810 [Lindgomyces ingoldianus]|uniref:Uncharacterized protein n=1 Tax=Lindgomyces ingoldianus TaxID=673940 RepID=A0ACB6QHX4_9PLEO|nr:uncharacterized protein BDR25DRAFT_359810 [Lindgomyces ingoldianus]KAF2466481.1 hypothetical protein BDR25DRAFT_359810 [Lindgomyces ingoldianus]
MRAPVSCKHFDKRFVDHFIYVKIVLEPIYKGVVNRWAEWQVINERLGKPSKAPQESQPSTEIMISGALQDTIRVKPGLMHCQSIAMIRELSRCFHCTTCPTFMHKVINRQILDLYSIAATALTADRRGDILRDEVLPRADAQDAVGSDLLTASLQLLTSELYFKSSYISRSPSYLLQFIPALSYWGGIDETITLPTIPKWVTLLKVPRAANRFLIPLSILQSPICDMSDLWPDSELESLGMTHTKSRHYTQANTPEHLQLEQKLSLACTKPTPIIVQKTSSRVILVGWYTLDDYANPLNWVSWRDLALIPIIGPNPLYILTFIIFLVLSFPKALVESFGGLQTLRFFSLMKALHHLFQIQRLIDISNETQRASFKAIAIRAGILGIPAASVTQTTASERCLSKRRDILKRVPYCTC